MILVFYLFADQRPYGSILSSSGETQSQFTEGKNAHQEPVSESNVLNQSFNSVAPLITSNCIQKKD